MSQDPQAILKRWLTALLVVIVLSAINGCMSWQDAQAEKEYQNEHS